MPKLFDISLYNDEFFEWHYRYARDYSIRSMDWLIDSGLIDFASIVDFGCGIASYIESAFNHGITQLKGYDIGGDFAKVYTPEHIQPFVEYLDCTQPISFSQKYDLAISFETAEHIEPSGTGAFVQNIVDSLQPFGILLFTAAPPGQDGCGHINCHPKEYWRNLFHSKGLIPNGSVESQIKDGWSALSVPTYITDNLIVLQK